MNEYKKAGVDVEAGYESVERIKKHVGATARQGVLSAIGGFGGLFQPDLTKYKEPVLVSGTDGVGTKLKIAFSLDKHDTVGIDCVAMCANDIACSGGEPLFFLDYIACGKNFPEKIEQIVKGVSDGCIQAGCAIIGGETAEMPGFYPENEYDLAGFCVGIVEKGKIIDGSTIKSGDVLVGVPSSGVHSNGFSLIRKVFGDSPKALGKSYAGLDGTIGSELIKPTRIYVKMIKELMDSCNIKGISHITGGGFIENIPRMLPEGTKAVVQKGSWPILPVFNILAKEGKIDENSMYGTFNMGIGLVICVSEKDCEQTISVTKGFRIGRVESGSGIDLLQEVK